jgi:DNA-binding protein H-NS
MLAKLLNLPTAPVAAQIARPVFPSIVEWHILSFSRTTFTQETMPTYKELLSQKAKLEEQLEAVRLKELEQVIVQVKQVVADYGLTAEDLGLAPKGKARAKRVVAPKYQDPKTGATWTGRGRAPAWIAGKNYERFLIA